MELNDLLSLNYEPFVKHFMKQATGKDGLTYSKNNLVVVRAKKDTNKKADASVKLVTPVSQNIDQAKEAVKKSSKDNSIIPAEITTFEGVGEVAKSKKRKRNQPSKKAPQKKKRKINQKDIFSK